MFVINVMHTSMGFRIEVPVRVIELAILKFAEDNLHAPKMGRDHGRITVEKGDAYYVHVPSMNWFYFHKDYFHRIKQIVLNTAIEYNKQVEVKEHTYQRGEPYKCEFDNYGFQMEVTDPESRFYYQNEVVEKALDPLYLQIIFAIQTGRGKTKSAQKVMVKRGVRTVLIHRPTYVAKWKFDCIDDETGLRVDEKHVYVAQGTQGIYDLIEDGRSGKLDRMGIKVVILPTVSLFNFMKEAIATMASSPVNFESFYDDIGAGQEIGRAHV